MWVFIENNFPERQEGNFHEPRQDMLTHDILLHPEDTKSNVRREMEQKIDRTSSVDKVRTEDFALFCFVFSKINFDDHDQLSSSSISGSINQTLSWIATCSDPQSHPTNFFQTYVLQSS